jgi:hypothetical protein
MTLEYDKVNGLALHCLSSDTYRIEPDTDEIGAMAHGGLVIHFSPGRTDFDHGPGYLGCEPEQVLHSIRWFCPISFMIHLLPMSFNLS